MSLESPDNEKNFPEEDGERGGLGKKRDSSRKRDGKKDKKDKGYTMFQEEESEEEIVVPDDIKSPTKAKKTKPGFKFPAKKDIFPRMKEKDEKKDKKEEKEKKKEEKEGKKVKVKDKEKKKSKHGRLDLSKPAPPPAATCENPIFGIPLALSVERNKSHDGIQLPAIVRECIDYVEECGLTCEGIYRISGVKSKVQQLKDCYNKGVPVDLVEHEPNIVASLLKQFLREMPEPVLTTTLMPKFEEASTIKNEKKKVDTFIRLINELPACNRLLLSWMIVHMTHIIELQKENKMSLQNVSIVLSPTMQISHRVLNALFTLAHQIFKDTYLKKYVPPLKPATSRWSLELPDNTGALEEELSKQESLLNQLHARLNAGRADQDDEEQLWEVQRVVTQLKRKIKFAQKTQGTAERRRKDLEVKRSSQLSDTEELHLELRLAPAPPPPATTTTTAVVETHANEAEKMGSKESIPAADVETAEGKETPTGEKATQVSAKEEKDVKKETRKSREMKAQGDRAETKMKRKSQEVVEKQNSEEQEKRKPQNVKEKRKSEEITSSEVEAQATSEAVASEQPAETPVESTEKDTPEETKADVTSEPEKKEASPEEAAKSEPAEEGKELSVVLTKAEGEEGEGEGGEKDTSEAVTLKDSLKGAGEVVGKVAAAAAVVVVVPKKVEPAVVREKPAEIPVRPVPTIVEEKPRGPVQVHPHLYLSQEPLQPIKAQPLKPRRERAEKTEEWRRHSAKLRELEEELLGGGSTRKEDSEGGTQNAEGDKLEVGEEEDYEYDMADDEELQRIVEEEFSLRLEEEELLAIGDELRKKIETEQSEIERLQQEIQELQYLRHDSDLEEMSSASDSSYESEDEEDMNDMLSSLIQENLQLERENAEMCQKIHEERMICLSVKLQIRLLQQKQLESSQSSLLGDA